MSVGVESEERRPAGPVGKHAFWKRLRLRSGRSLQELAGSYRKIRRAVARRSPRWLRRLLSPVMERYDLYMVDHGVFRCVYSNTHEVAPGFWRSSQPAPYQIGRFARRGIRTIINLRGERDCGSYRLEAEACRRHGVRLVDFPHLRSRSAPGRAAVANVRALLDGIEYPALVHCKSGADRAGLMSCLYLHFKEGLAIERAKEQLHIRYGHMRQAETGVLDFFFDQYLAHDRRSPTPFLQWVEGVYDPVELKRSFRSRVWADLLTNWLARRE
jgi:protein tyrosine phosphatase (PTP) superfamily phosphohydrolase (DUF442 family)